MRMWMIGFLTTLVGAAVAVVGYFYLAFSLWLIIPGGILVLIGMSLLSGAQENMLSQVRYSVSDSLKPKDGRGPENKGS